LYFPDNIPFSLAFQEVLLNELIIQTKSHSQIKIYAQMSHSLDVILLLQIIELLLHLCCVSLLELLMRLIVETNEVLARDIEPVQMVYCVLCIIDVLIHHEGSALGLASVPPIETPHYKFDLPPDLSERPILPENVIELLGSDLKGKVPHKDYAIHLRRQSHLNKNSYYFVAYVVSHFRVHF
jgi:hypothetical protein